MYKCDLFAKIRFFPSTNNVTIIIISIVMNNDIKISKFVTFIAINIIYKV